MRPRMLRARSDRACRRRLRGSGGSDSSTLAITCLVWTAQRWARGILRRRLDQNADENRLNEKRDRDDQDALPEDRERCEHETRSGTNKRAVMNPPQHLETPASLGRPSLRHGRSGCQLLEGCAVKRPARVAWPSVSPAGEFRELHRRASRGGRAPRAGATT